MIQSWEHFYSPTKIYQSNNSLIDIPPILEKFGDRVLVLALDKEVQDQKKLQLLIDEVHNNTAGCIFYEQLYHKEIIELKDLETVAHFVRKSYVNLIVAYGGIEIINIAKTVILLASNPIKAEDILLGNKEPEEESIPLVIFLSTPAFGEELSGFLTLKNLEKKNNYYVENEVLIPKLCVYDTSLSMHFNEEKSIKIIAGLMTYAIECLLSKKSQYYSTFMCTQSLQLVYNYLEAFIKDPTNEEYIEKMYLASAFLGLGIQTTSLGLTWVLSHVINSKLPNSIDFFYSLSILLPKVMENYLTHSTDILVYIAKQLNQDIRGLSKVEAGIRTIELMKKLFLKLCLPYSFKDFTLDKYYIPSIAKKVVEYPHISTIPSKVTIHNIEALLLTCL